MPARDQTGRRGGRVAVIAVIALVAIVGLSAAAFKYFDKPHSGHPSGGHSSTHTTTPVAQTVILRPQSASGFDALHTASQDPTDENSSLAPNLVNSATRPGWQTCSTTTAARSSATSSRAAA